jgi:hypothetical protein
VLVLVLGAVPSVTIVKSLAAVLTLQLVPDRHTATASWCITTILVLVLVL